MSLTVVKSLYSQTNGRVGIGTTMPTSMLEVTENIKAGKFTDRADSSYYIKPGATDTAGLFKGKVGIGTTNPTQQLDIDGQIRIRGGNPANNKVLVSDNNGVGSWQTLTKSDVGLGNVRNVDLNNAAGDFLNYDTNNEEFNVQAGNMGWNDLAISKSDVAPSDVNLATLSSGPSINGGNYDGTTPRNWDVNWSDANDLDGNGNVLDSDQLDGQDGSYYKQDLADVMNQGNVASQNLLMDVHDINMTNANSHITFENPNNTLIELGDDVNTVSGIGVKATQNPNNGDPIFVVQSAGGNQRLRVEHAGALKTSNRLEVDGTGDSYINSQLGIGTSSPSQRVDVNGQIRIRGGNPGNNKVLVSNSNGVGSWQNLSKSDVGLGNVRNVDLNNAAGSFLTYNTSAEEFNVQAANMDWNDLGISRQNLYNSMKGDNNNIHVASNPTDQIEFESTSKTSVTVNNTGKVTIDAVGRYGPSDCWNSVNFNNNEEVVLGDANKMFCFLTQVSGDFQGSGERVKTFVNANNKWVISGTTGAGYVEGCANCFIFKD